MVQLGDLVGMAELAHMLGVSSQRANQLSHTPDFPAPIATLRVGRIWRRNDVRSWARHHGRRVIENDQSLDDGDEHPKND